MVTPEMWLYETITLAGRGPRGNQRPGCGIIRCMTLLNLRTPQSAPPPTGAHLAEASLEAEHPVLRVLSLASLVVGATALGLYIGRELRQRYKFKRRTPSDFYSKAGDPVSLTEYGMGV